MKKFILPLLAVSLIFTACKKDEKDPEPDTTPTPTKDLSQYFPTNSGLYWVYDYSNANDNNTERVDNIAEGTKKFTWERPLYFSN